MLVAGLLVVVLTVGVGLFVRFGGRGEPATVEAPVVPGFGGTYVEGALGAPSTLNPLLARTQAEQDLARLLFRGLTRVDGSGTAQPDLAASWSVSDDGLTYTFTLRDDARWHDGEPVTAQDVRFTVGLVQDPEFPGDEALARFWRGVVVSVPSADTVVFQLLEPFAAFPTYAALPIVPKHLLGGVLARDLADDPFASQPVGTGPFRFDNRQDDGQVVEITLRAYEDFPGGRPYLDQVVFRYYEDVERLLEALRDGSVQGTGAVPAEQLLRPGVLPKGAIVYASPMPGYTALFFNMRDPLFASADVRRAIDLALDRERIVKGPLDGRAEVGFGPIPVTSWAYGPPGLVHDPQAAKDLLEAAGWTDADGDGVRERGASRLSFSLLVNDDDPERVAVAQEIVGQLQRIGVQAVVQPMPAREVSGALTSRQFSAALFGWHSATGDPDCYHLWHSAFADEGLNFTGWRNREVDTLLTEARQTPEQDKRRELYARFQAVFADQVPAIPLYYPRYYFAVDADVHGVEPVPIIRPSDRLDGLARWFVETSGAATATP